MAEIKQKQLVLEAVAAFKRPVGISELWDKHCVAWVKAGNFAGQTPKNTLSRNLGELVKENRVIPVKPSKNTYVSKKDVACGNREEKGKVARDPFLYCIPGSCDQSKAKKTAPKKTAAKKRASATAKKPAAKKTTAAKEPVAAQEEEKEQEQELGGFFEGGGEEPDVEQGWQDPALRSAKSSTSAQSSAKASTQPKKRKASKTPQGVKRRKTSTVCHVVKVRDSFINSVAKIFHNEQPRFKISRKAVCAIDAIVREQVELIGQRAQEMLHHGKQVTLGSRTLKMAVALCYRTELAEHMQGAGKDAIDYLVADKRKASRAARARLLIAPSRVGRLLKAQRVASRYSAYADVYFAGAMQYLIQELVKGASRTLGEKHKRLSPRDLMLAVNQDDDMRVALRGTFGSGGVVPKDEAKKTSK